MQWFLNILPNWYTYLYYRSLTYRLNFTCDESDEKQRYFFSNFTDFEVKTEDWQYNVYNVSSVKKI